jgi:hypothetical protein
LYLLPFCFTVNSELTHPTHLTIFRAGGTARKNKNGVQKQSFWNKKLRFLTPTKLFSEEPDPACGTATQNENGARGGLQPNPFVHS